ncbi:MAG: dihydrolipoyllysine-residue acetyltransferase [Gammaproteobacteria bacterium]|nr:dihydrolipoyllysine-residue acetyltransferase [Gammaproteobacteria bacterium]
MSAEQTIKIPELGDVDSVDVVEILVEPGQTVEEGTPLLTLENQKTAMELPAPIDGVVKSILVSLGDQVAAGADVVVIDAQAVGKSDAAEPAKPESTPAPAEPAATEEQPAAPAPAATQPTQPVKPQPPASQSAPAAPGKSTAFASPSVRRFARELGADINQISGTGTKGRILKSDVQAWIKSSLASNQSGGPVLGSPMPEIDFSKFGTIEEQNLSRIQKVSGKHLHRCWVHIPHVTQQDQADITDLEAFRKSLNAEKNQSGAKITLLPLVMKAVTATLQAYPTFNASLASNGEQLILKHYYNIGVAVDTPEGLVVPVIRDVDKKGIRQLAQELAEVSQRARDRKLTPTDMEGGSFTISSLGGIGGTAFTPIVNAPEVAILGVSRSSMQPVYQDGQFVPRLMLPLSLSYDHRVIDGANGARFIVYLSRALSDLRRVLV